MQKPTYFWFFYLGLTFVLLTGIPEYLFVTPLCLLGFFYRPAWGFATKINRCCMRIVLWAQPWYNAQVKIYFSEPILSHRKGVLLVANHRSHIDVMICLAQISHLRILAKYMLFFLPLYGHLIWLLQMIPVRRNDSQSYLKAMKTLENGLLRKDRILVFPEMTRCKRGELKTGRFTLPPFQAAMRTQSPIVPLVYWGTDAVWSKGSQKISLNKKIWVESLAEIDSRQFSSAQELAIYVQNQIDSHILLMSEKYLQS